MTRERRRKRRPLLLQLGFFPTPLRSASVALAVHDVEAVPILAEHLHDLQEEVQNLAPLVVPSGIRTLTGLSVLRSS
jgi:hypothetical protein